MADIEPKPHRNGGCSFCTILHRVNWTPSICLETLLVNKIKVNG